MPRDSRSALLAAAAEEFARFGPKGARIQAIVQRAGINERMIYHHFGSKDGLYAAVLEAQASGLIEAWRQVIHRAAGMAPYEGMQAVLAGFADLLAARPQLVALSALVGSMVLKARGAAVMDSAALGADPARLRDQVVGQLLDGMTGRPQRAGEGVRQ